MMPSVFRPLFRSNFRGVGEKGDDVVPTAFFNGLDTRDQTYSGGPSVVADNLGVLNVIPVDTPAISNARYSGGIFSDTDAGGTPLWNSVSQRTRVGAADFSSFTAGPSFKNYLKANPSLNPALLPGQLFEPSRTNKCTCRKVNPIDTTGLTTSNSGVLSIVTGQEALLAAAGLGNIATSGAVYRLNNLSNATDSKVSFSGAATTANAHSMSMYARAVAGTANMRYHLVSKTDELFPSDRLGRLSWENRTTTVGDVLVLECSPYSDVYFIMPQLEEGPFCTSPMYNTGDALGSATRAATVAKYNTAGKIRDNNMAFRIVCSPSAPGQTNVRLFSTYTDASNYLAIHLYNNSVTLRKMLGGSTIDSTVTQVSDGKPLDIIAVVTITGMRIAVRYYDGGWTSFVQSSLNADGTDAVIASTYQVGSMSSTQQFAGKIHHFDTRFIPSNVTDPLAWAKKEFGVA